MFFILKKVCVALMLPCFLFCGCHSVSHKPSTPDISPKPPVPKTSVVDGIWQTDDVDISRVQADKKLVALTFDDAPTSKLNALLDVFVTFNRQHPNTPATATLFCNGHGLLSRHREGLETAFALGMELGNHSFSHKHLPLLSPEKIKEEIARVDCLLEEIDGKPAHLFRAPYGHLDDKVIDQVQTPIIDWYIDTEDWANQSATTLIERVWERIEDGAIILMHDGYDSTVEGVRLLLPALLNKGYQAVTLSQMAKAHHCPLAAKKVYTRARKQYKKA